MATADETLTDEQILLQLRADVVEKRCRDQQTTFYEAGVQRESELRRERQDKLGVSLTSLLARIEANVSLLHPPPSREMTSDASSSSSSSSSELKVGIALMTRQPHRFDWWLRYHRSLGVHHVFVHVEDSPELLPLLQADEFKDFVIIVATSGDEGDGCSDVNVSDGAIASCQLPPSARMGNCASAAGLDPSGLASHASVLTSTPPADYSLMDRQERHVDRSLQLARQRGVDWLFHIDDDELLHFDVPFATLVSAPLPHVRCRSVHWLSPALCDLHR